MIGLLIQDNAFEQDIRELLMSFYPGEIYAHEVKDGVAFYVESRLRDGEVLSLIHISASTAATISDSRCWPGTSVPPPARCISRRKWRTERAR